MIFNLLNIKRSIFFVKKYNNINGIFLLDKPKGFSSNFTLQKIKKIFFAKKAGYSGSLDPLVTGVLPICFGKATKFSECITNFSKEYHVIAYLGEKTSTCDIQGNILKTRLIKIHKNKIIKVLKNFRGIIYQIPSMYSALKHKGIPLYKYARRGIEIKRHPRKINIYKLKYIQFKYNFLELKVECSRGTYIRNLIDDIGEALGCGAHVVFLRRLKVGPYLVSNSISFSMINEILSNNSPIQNNTNKYFLYNYLFSIYSLVLHFPKINLSEKEGNEFRIGKTIMLSKKYNIGTFRVTSGFYNTFIGVGLVSVLGFLTRNRILSLNI